MLGGKFIEQRSKCLDVFLMCLSDLLLSRRALDLLNSNGRADHSGDCPPVWQRGNVHAIEVPDAPALWTGGCKPNDPLEEVLNAPRPSPLALPLCQHVILAKAQHWNCAQNGVQTNQIRKDYILCKQYRKQDTGADKCQQRVTSGSGTHLSPRPC